VALTCGILVFAVVFVTHMQEKHVIVGWRNIVSLVPAVTVTSDLGWCAYVCGETLKKCLERKYSLISIKINECRPNLRKGIKMSRSGMWSKVVLVGRSADFLNREQ
jgi:hypothetical protein